MDLSRYGRYQATRLLGSGGMGAVYLARDELLGREVAIKTIRALPMMGAAAELFRARFLNEARAVAALSHANIVRVFDLGFEGETPYLVMEVVPGASLKDRLEARGRLTPVEARVLGVQVARALQAAHAAGILHRDVKPGNVLEAEPGAWKLADFGVAHVPDSSLTISGQFLGSPAYAAPEAMDRGESSQATDVYGLGATLYEALTGEPPYGRGGMISVAVQASRSEPRHVRELNADVPEGLAAALMQALARDPARRPSAAAFAESLAAASLDATSAPGAPGALPVLAPATRPPSPRRRRILLAAIGAGAVLLVGVGIELGGAGRDAEGPPPPSFGAPTMMWQGPGEAEGRDEKQDERWRKVQEKLEDGRPQDAEKELRKILERDPYDEQARALLERIHAARPRRGRGD